MRRWTILLLLLVLISPKSWAQNVGFESGSTAGWTSSGGDVTVSTGTGNVSYGGGLTWNIKPYGTYMAQLYPSGSTTFDSALSSLGLTSVENTAIRNYLTQQSQTGGGNPTPTNASWIKTTVTLQAGMTYSFAWNYLSTDYTPFNDGSLITLTHATNNNITPTLNNLQQRYGLLGFTNPGTGEYSTGSYGSTGWQLAVFTVPESGEYVLGFTSFNLGDTVLSPMLFIDEIQGETILNGQPFAPVAPNPGSSAPTTPSGPTLCCGGSAAVFAANAAFVTRQTNFAATGDSQVIIEQIGNTNSATITQSGAGNYTEARFAGSSNSLTVNQTTVPGANNYFELAVVGSTNTFSITQNSTGGNKGILANITDSNNAMTINQSGTGAHYAEINLAGGGKTVDLTQSGTANHMAKIELSGGATSITAAQTGATQQYYSITHTCATASCAAITVTQGQ